MQEQIAQLQQTVAGKLDASAVVNTTSVTQAGFAADARQMNPAVSGSIAGKVEDILSYPRIRQVAGINLWCADGIPAHSWKTIETDISQYGFQKIPQAFVGSNGWYSVHSVNVISTQKMQTTLLNMADDAKIDGARIVLIEFI